MEFAALSSSPIPPIPIIALSGANDRIIFVIAICFGRRGVPLIPPFSSVYSPCCFFSCGCVPTRWLFHASSRTLYRISGSVVVLVELYPVTYSLLASMIIFRVSSSVSGDILRNTGLSSATSRTHLSALIKISIFFCRSCAPA